MLKLNNITKYYGSKAALRGFDLHVKSGQVYGLLGPNGSGKSTAVSIALGLIQPSLGSVHLMGNENTDITRRLIGIAPEKPCFYPHLTGIENLKAVAAHKGLMAEDIETAREIIDFAELDKKYSKLSMGTQQRLSIACAFLGNPSFIILDEPTNGFDPVGVIDLRNLIVKHHKQGKTFLIASHNLPEMGRICTHIGIIKKGQLIRSLDLEDHAEDIESLFMNTLNA